MVIGSGMLAKAFESYKHNDSVVVFASGVSNSKETSINEFNREYELLRNTLDKAGKRTIVYFSTFNLYLKEEVGSPYCQHKIKLEKYIEKRASKYYIFRLGHVVGAEGNPKNIIRFLYEAVKTQRLFHLWANAERNLIDIDHVYSICNLIIEKNIFRNSIINICNKTNISVLNIVQEIELLIGHKGRYEIVQKGTKLDNFSFQLDKLTEILSIDFNENYASKLIAKYYV